MCENFTIKACFSLLLIILSVDIYTQYSDNEKYDFLDAEYYYSIGDYNKALGYYIKLVESYPDNPYFNFNTGKCYLNIIGEEGEALRYLEKAVSNVEDNFKASNIKNEGSPPTAWLFLGDALHREQRLKEASYAYHQYKNYVEEDKEQLEIVYKRIRGLGISYESMARPRAISMYNLGGNINSEYSDYNPVLSGDQKTLAFTSYRKPLDKIKISYFENDKWTVPIDITKEVGANGNCYSTAISYNGDELYIVNYDLYNSDIFVSRKENGKWTRKTPLDKRINSKFHESNASISSDGNTLYFSSDRTGGEGQFDLYFSVKEEEGWSKPENLGSVINTSGNEEAPFISEDGNTLYFSSDGHETIGKMDLVYSERNEKGEWQVPVNMGTPFNTTDDEVAFAFFQGTKTGYISRADDNSFGKKDIYVLQFNEEGKFTEQVEIEPVVEDVISQQAIVEEEILITPDKKDIVETVVEKVVESEVVYEEPESDYKQPIELAEKLVISDFRYTIQIMALIFPQGKGYFKNLELNRLKVSAGTDGFHRYTYGEYSTLTDARTELRQIIELGYKDAFVRDINSISNY